jgi:hypothetical protein
MTIDSRTVALKHKILAPSDEPTGFHSTFLNSIEPDRLREEEKQHPQNYTGQYPKCNGKLDFRMHEQKKKQTKEIAECKHGPVVLSSSQHSVEISNTQQRLPGKNAVTNIAVPSSFRSKQLQYGAIIAFN